MKKHLVLIGGLFFWLSGLPVSALSPTATPTPLPSPTATPTPPAAVIQLNPSGKLFLNGEVWWPGKSQTKTVRVINNSDNDRWLGLRGERLNPNQGLASVLYLSVNDGNGVCLYGAGPAKSLRNFIADGEIDLHRLIPAHGEQLLSISITMDPAAGNEFQQQTTSLDFVFGFFPTPTLTPTPTPALSTTPTPTPVTATPTVTATVSNATPTPSTCSATPPAAPTSLVAAAAGPGQILLSWQPPPSGVVSHYAILYGLTAGHYLYGNFNVGQTTHYLVTGLTSGQRYYFTVRAIHDCAPGPDAREVSSLAGAGAGTNTGGQPANGFQVLGKKTKEGKLLSGLKKTTKSEHLRKGYPLPPLAIAGGAVSLMTLLGFWYYYYRRH